MPQHDRIFCTWPLEVSPDALTSQAGALSAAKLAQLGTALRLAGGEPRRQA